MIRNYRRFRLIILVVVGISCVGALLFFLWRHPDYLNQIDPQAMADVVAEKGPLPFFAAMSLLPALGAPVSPFCITAGVLFEPAVAIFGVVTSLVFNMVFCWVISGRLFRPVFERVLTRMGYTVPQLGKRSMFQAALLIRITPSIPFTVQNYLLGLAGMPFILYLLVSVPLVLLYGVCYTFFGEVLLEGDVLLLLSAFSLVVATTLLFGVLRRRISNRPQS